MVRSSRIPHFTTYSAMCPAKYPTPPVEDSATFSASRSDLSSILSAASSSVTSLIPPRRSSSSASTCQATSDATNVAEPRPAVASTALATVDEEDESRALESASQLKLEAQPGLYSIRIPEPSGDTRCPQCQNEFLASGPTGFAGEQPICDLCLFEASKSLGMVMALTAVARTFGAADVASDDDYQQASEELATFARIYEIFAAKTGPARPFRLPAN